MDQEIAKQAAGKSGASFVQSGMIVGLGSGSTALHFIQALIQRCQEGLQIQAVSSSRESAALAKAGGIEILDLNAVSKIDLTVDGADEIDPQKRMIKGGGGAHVREKIMASSSREMIVIIDESKRVTHLGHKKLPVEIIPYGSQHTLKKIEALGYRGDWRRQKKTQELFITENQNLLLDLHIGKPLDAPEELEKTLLQVPGIVDTGFFFHLADKVIVGFKNGTVQIT